MAILRVEWCRQLTVFQPSPPALRHGGIKGKGDSPAESKPRIDRPGKLNPPTPIPSPPQSRGRGVKEWPHASGRPSEFRAGGDRAIRAPQRRGVADELPQRG